MDADDVEAIVVAGVDGASKVNESNNPIEETDENKFDDDEDAADGGKETSFALSCGDTCVRSNDDEEPDNSDGDVDNWFWLPLKDPCIDVADTMRGGREAWKSC